jgi:hypothetical protein
MTQRLFALTKSIDTLSIVACENNYHITRPTLSVSCVGR